MDFHFGSDVRERDGNKLGTLRRVVYNPDTRQVASLVVQHEWFDEREVLVPIGAVFNADGDSVELELSAELFDGLPNFEDTRNVAPPPELEGPIPDEIKDPVDVPDVPPVGAATGIESIAFTPIVQETLHVPSGDEVIDGETVVWATDGEIGRVVDVVTDDQTNRVDSLVVERGTIFKHDSAVPLHWVGAIRPETIVLTVDRNTVRQYQDE